MSLREQLLAAGLGTRKQAKQAEHQQRQQARNQQAAQEAAKKREERAAAAAAKAARDRELNRQQQERAEKKARWAQIRQLIEENRIAKPESDDYFNFIDREKVRRIPVDAALRERLIRGEVMIVRCEGRYDLVPPEIAAKIGEREPRAVVSLEPRAEVGADDPYKDYVVPDDLMW
jgi:uncharacterized protein YaiL (DUF2058 family)